jgi:hypothetical protein
MLKQLTLTPTLRAAIDSVHRAEAAYRRGQESAEVVEIPKLGLADEVLVAVAAQTEAARRATLARLPKAKAAVVPVVDIALRRKARRRRA